MTTDRLITVDLTHAELLLLLDALDSHDYWQLTPPHKRSDATSRVEDGADADIDATRALARKLEQLRNPELCRTCRNTRIAMSPESGPIPCWDCAGKEE